MAFDTPGYRDADASKKLFLDNCPNFEMTLVTCKRTHLLGKIQFGGGQDKHFVNQSIIHS